MELNKKNIKSIILILFATVTFAIALVNFNHVVDFIQKIIGILMPVILGLCIAFLLNPLASVLEKKVFGGLGRRFTKRGPALARTLSIAAALIVVLGTLVLLAFIIIPEVREAFVIISETLPSALGKAVIDINSFIAKLGFEFRIPSNGIEDWKALFLSAADYLSKTFDSGVIGNIANTAMSVVGGVMNFIFGLMLSLYILMQKEKIGLFANRFLHAFFKKKTVTRIRETASLANVSFRNFVTGQLTEAVIIGLLCFVGLLIFRFPYPTAASAIIGLTALVPIFGAWVGGILGALLALSQSFSKALLFIVFLIVLQQLESNLIYPRVVGKSVGIPGMLVFISVLLGGSVAGVVGMLLGVPTCSIVYSLVKKAIDKRLADKSIQVEAVPANNADSVK
ncbi:MAG: AI-2E family transporter [Oscillospiraceae bacterium]